MTPTGLKFLSEAKFDIDQLQACCTYNDEVELVQQLQDTIDELESMQSRYYNRRKDEVILKSSSNHTNS